MYKIEKMEAIKREGSDTLVTLVKKLEVGEGFYIPAARSRSAAALASRIGKALKRRFGVYKVDDERVQVVRREDPK